MRGRQGKGYRRDRGRDREAEDECDRECQSLIIRARSSAAMAKRNANINSAMLYPFTDPNSPAGGISIDG